MSRRKWLTLLFIHSFSTYSMQSSYITAAKGSASFCRVSRAELKCYCTPSNGAISIHGTISIVKI